MPALLAVLRPRPLVLLAVAAALVGAAPAQAQTAEVTGVEATFRAAPADDEFSAGFVTVVFRTEEALPLNVHGMPRGVARLGGDGTSLLTVSRAQHCYAVFAEVLRRGKASRSLRPGGSTRVSVGRGGAVLDRRVTITRRTPATTWGASLGCAGPPDDRTVIFDMYPPPEVQPGRFFFTANAGPYLEDIVWTNWGAETATGTATYVSDCASCGPKQEYAVDVTVDRRIACAPYGTAYDRLRFVRAGGAHPDDPRRRGVSGEAELYC